MKKLLATLFLIVFLFNIGGYYVFFWGLHFTATVRLNNELDAGNYSSDETFEFKVPLTVPYPIYDNGFGRAHGDFEYAGEFYTLVKQKLENDTLYVVCIKNRKKQQLAEAFTEFASVSNDTGNPASKAGNDLLSKLIKDFNGTGHMEVIQRKGWCRLITFFPMVQATIDMYMEVDSPPPNFLFS